MTASAPPTPTPTRRDTASLLDPLFTTARMREIFCDGARVQAMLDFEAALARSEARLGVIPAAAAPAIEAHCRAELYDAAGLGAAAALAGNLAIPLVRLLTDAVARADAEAARYVHWGSTSQDVIDTGMVLQVRAGLDLIEAELARLSQLLAKLAAAHARTPMAARTLLQQALPTTFGLKAAGWLSAVTRDRVRLRALRPRALTLQLGGAAGTLASLGEFGLEVGASVATELKLVLPDVPWHAQRDRMAEVAATLGLLVGTLGKVGRDLVLLMQSEVGEAREAAEPGRGGSSTLPHKRNPLGATMAVAAATRVPGLVATMLSAMPQEHERAAGGWQAEWDTLPEIFLLAAGALAHVIQAIHGLEVDEGRMHDNLGLTGGLLLAEAVVTALAPHLGRMEAHRHVEVACREALAGGRRLRDVLAGRPEVARHLDEARLAALLDPRGYTGLAEVLVSRALAAAETLGDRGH